MYNQSPFAHGIDTLIQCRPSVLALDEQRVPCFLYWEFVEKKGMRIPWLRECLPTCHEHGQKHGQKRELILIGHIPLEKPFALPNPCTILIQTEGTNKKGLTAFPVNP